MSYWPEDPKKNPHPEHQRKGPDLFVKWVRLSSFLVWLFVAITVVFIDSAGPELYTILDMQYNKIARNGWNFDLLMNAFFLSIGTFLFALISLIVNSQRLKRKTDHISISLVLGLIVSGAMSIGLFMYYLGTITA